MYIHGVDPAVSREATEYQRSPRRQRPVGDQFSVQRQIRKGPRGGVHRAHFLDELVKLVPDGIAQFQKRLQDVTEAEDGSGLCNHTIIE